MGSTTYFSLLGSYTPYDGGQSQGWSNLAQSTSTVSFALYNNVSSAMGRLLVVGT